MSAPGVRFFLGMTHADNASMQAIVIMGGIL